MYKNEYQEVKADLEQIEMDKIEGLIVQSRIQWHEQGEKSTKYFMQQLKSNSNKKHTRKLKLQNGSVTTNPTIILNAQKK